MMHNQYAQHYMQREKSALKQVMILYTFT